MSRQTTIHQNPRIHISLGDPRMTKDLRGFVETMRTITAPNTIVRVKIPQAARARITKLHSTAR